MAKRATRPLVAQNFDYLPLEPKLARLASEAAERIRRRVKKTIEDIIDVGKELLSVKGFLPHGQFGAWLKAEFGWSERTAQNFMSVGERFGDKSAMIADLTLQPTAAYLLAAPAVPDEARAQAISRAEAGEKITAAVAKRIVAETRKGKEPPKARDLPADALALQLVKILGRYRDRWDSGKLVELARQLREFANTLDPRDENGKRTPKSTRRRRSATSGKNSSDRGSAR